MKTTIKNVSRLVLSLLFVMGLGNCANAQVIVSDTFTLDGVNRTAGAQLNGLPPEVGTGTWVATPDAVFTSAGAITTSTDGGSPSAEIAIPTLTSSITTVQADLVTNTSGWEGVGFQSSPSTSNVFTPSMLAILYSSGAVQLFDYAGSTFTQVGNTYSVPSYVSTDPYTLAVQYNPNTQLATVLLDGTAVLSSESITVSGPIASAGFFGNGIGTAGDATIDNFEVSAVAAPEPSAYALSLIACAMLVFISRFRKQVKS
jgi:hypothetical protein